MRLSFAEFSFTAQNLHQIPSSSTDRTPRTRWTNVTVRTFNEDERARFTRSVYLSPIDLIRGAPSLARSICQRLDPAAFPKIQTAVGAIRAMRAPSILRPSAAAFLAAVKSSPDCAVGLNYDEYASKRVLSAHTYVTPYGHVDESVAQRFRIFFLSFFTAFLLLLLMDLFYQTIFHFNYCVYLKEV